MSLSKSINSPFAWQEGSDIAAIKKLPNLSLQSVLKRTLFKWEKSGLYMCEEFPFPVLLTELLIEFQCAQVGWVVGSWCIQIPPSPVTKIQLENGFIDLRGLKSWYPYYGMLMQFQGYMASLWICIHEVKGWAWLWGCSRLLSDVGNYQAWQGWSYLLAAAGRTH